MSINKKLVKIFQEVSALKFTKEDMTIMNGVEFLADRTVKDKIRPVFVKNGVTPISSNQYDKANGVVRIHVVYINDEDDTEFTQTVEHPINDLLWGGGNITLANKYAYILFLMIGTSDDVILKPGVTREQVADNSFQKIEKKHGVTKAEMITDPVLKDVLNDKEKSDLKKAEEKENSRDKNHVHPDTEVAEKAIVSNADYIAESIRRNKVAEEAIKENRKHLTPSEDLHETVKETLEQPEIGFPDGTPTNLKELVTQVQKTEKLEPIAEKPVEKPKDEPDELLFERLNEGWRDKLELTDCINELTAMKALDAIYKYKGTEIYGDSELEKCPVNPRTLINKIDARPSNLKVRNMLAQYRVYGEEAFWTQVLGEFKITKEQALAAMNLAPAVVVAEKKETVPYVEFSLGFEVSENVGGDRPMEDVLSIIQNLTKMGITKWAIMASLEKMTNKPDLDPNEPADGQISSFVAKASVGQIEEMVKIAMT